MSKCSIFLKFVILFVVGFSIGVGLCGLDFWLASKGIGKSTQEFGVGPLDGISLMTMFFSALGLILTLIIGLFTAIIRGMASKRRPL
jgi:hypothetical protein